MQKTITISLKRLTRQLIVSTALIVVAGLAIASKGGGGDKKKAANIPFRNNFTPIRTTNGFTLKAGPSYTGSYLLSQEKTSNSISFSTLATYQRGNALFIIPYKYKVNTSPYLNSSNKSNLQVLDLRIKMHR
jgi:hypothetical protein